MKTYFILFLLHLFACAQPTDKFKLIGSFPVSKKSPICINEKNCFCFRNDSSVYHLIMYQSNINCQQIELVDSVDFSPYKSTLHSFKSEKNNSFVIFWETEYEYFPAVLAYYFNEGKLLKIGEFQVSLPCQICESYNYPLQDIQIIQNHEDIEITFLKDINYKQGKEDKLKLFKPGSLKYSFNIANRKLSVITDT